MSSIWAPVPPYPVSTAKVSFSPNPWGTNQRAVAPAFASPSDVLVIPPPPCSDVAWPYLTFSAVLAPRSVFCCDWTSLEAFTFVSLPWLKLVHGEAFGRVSSLTTESTILLSMWFCDGLDRFISTKHEFTLSAHRYESLSDLLRALAAGFRIHEI